LISFRGLVLWHLAVLVVLPVSARAQARGVPAGESLIRLGPLALHPRLSLTNLGVDTNVHNAQERPERDLTATLVPGVDSRLRVGRAMATAKTSVEIVHFHRARALRSVAFSQEGRFEAQLARLTPFVAGGHTSTYQRLNLEIDERIDQTRDSVGGGLTVRLGARVSLSGAREQQRLRFGIETSPGIAAA